MIKPTDLGGNARVSKLRERKLSQTPTQEQIERLESPNPERDLVASKIRYVLPEILSIMTGESGVDVDTVTSQAVRRGWQNEKFYDYGVWYFSNSSGGSRNHVDLFVKVFPETPTENGQESPPLYFEKRVYEIMEDSGVVPKVFTVEGAENATGLDRVLFLEHGGRLNSENMLTGRNADGKLERRMTVAKREELEEQILRNIARFNAFAYDQSPEVFQEEPVMKWLREKRPTAEKAVRYFTEWLKFTGREEDPERLSGFAERYQVFEDIYGQNGVQLVHSDLRRQNIVGPDGEEWNSDNIKIVDLGSMAIASSLYSVAQFITSPGSKADEKRWNHLLHVYKCAEARERLGVIGGKGIEFTKDEESRAQARFYTAVIHTSMRGLYKIAQLRSEKPEEYARIMKWRPVLETHDADMFSNIRVAFRYMAKNAKELGLGQEGFDKVKCLEKELANYEPTSEDDKVAYRQPA